MPNSNIAIKETDNLSKKKQKAQAIIELIDQAEMHRQDAAYLSKLRELPETSKTEIVGRITVQSTIGKYEGRIFNVKSLAHLDATVKDSNPFIYAESVALAAAYEEFLKAVENIHLRMEAHCKEKVNEISGKAKAVSHA